ncbi:MAG: hypothetical protein U9O64_01955 [Campylobacterota bacterium]|nr:hypothetical protein [Campylobacterota bacterium]
MKPLRPAFTIIEILISVTILSFAIIFILKIHSDNQEQIVYISERNKRSLQDSLYLSPNILKHHKESKNAYELIEPFFKIKETESRELLKKNEREIFIPEAKSILPPQDTPGPTAVVNEIMLKGDHSSIYYRFELKSF